MSLSRAEAPFQMHDSYNTTETGRATKLVGFSYTAITRLGLIDVVMLRLLEAWTKLSMLSRYPSLIATYLASNGHFQVHGNL